METLKIETLQNEFQQFLVEYWKSHSIEAEKDKNSVKIIASKMNEYGQFSLSTNLPIFHERLKVALQDKETNKFILKLSILETTDPSYDD